MRYQTQTMHNNTWIVIDTHKHDTRVRAVSKPYDNERQAHHRALTLNTVYMLTNASKRLAESMSKRKNPSQQERLKQYLDNPTI